MTDYALQTVDHHHFPLFLGTGYRIGLGHDSIPAEVWMLSATLHLGTPESLDNFSIDARMFNVLLPTGDTVAFPGGGWDRYFITGNEIQFFDDMHGGKVITLSRGRMTRDGRLAVTGTIQRHSPTEVVAAPANLLFRPLRKASSPADAPALVITAAASHLPGISS